MTTYYVGAGGDNGNNGTTWALRKATLTGAEDIPVAAGDTVYVGPGTYRELLTCDVSGAPGSPITYIGDYTGANTDGVGGVVRITGSDNDQTATRANCITATAKEYREFRGFFMDTVTGASLVLWTSPVAVAFDKCYLHANSFNVTNCLNFSGAGQSAIEISECLFWGANNGGIAFIHTTPIDNCGHVVSNCIFHSSINSVFIYANYIGGTTVKNCLFIQATIGVYSRNLTAGQTTTVNNCILIGNNQALNAGALGMITEDYNCLYGNSTARVNTSTGAHSLVYTWLPDARWFFEMVNGGSMLSPFDLASYSQLINVAGTSPTTTDMRGTAVQGAEREWGALEYDSTLAGSGGGVNMPRVRVGH